MVNINYSISLPEDSPPPPRTPKLWAFCGVDIIPAPDDAVLLRRQDDDRRHLVRRDVAAVLNACQQFQTLETHARSAGDVIPELKGQPEHALPVLELMAEQGFLRSAEDVLARIRGSDQDNASDLAPPLAFIITCDRPTALRRLLESLATRPHDCRSITVIDDSRQPENQHANAQAVAEVATQLPTLQYFGSEARAQLIQQLVAALPEHEESIHCLVDRSQWGDQPTYGLARNLALLLSVGDRALILDDDILAEAHAAPERNETLRFGSVNDRSFAFFTDQTSMLNATRRLDQSPLSLSAAALGQSAGALLARHAAGPESLLGAEAAQWWDVANGQIGSTQCGTWGDPGTGDKAHWAVNLPEPYLKRLLVAGASITTTLSNRAVWMGYRNPMVMRFGAISQLTGLDHRALLPPYLPILRGEDFLFGVMLEKIAPDSLALGLPLGVPHLPVDNRGPVSFAGATAAQLSIRSMGQWLDAQPVTGIDRQSRLYDLARTIDHLCHRPPAEILDRLTAELTRQHVQQLAQLRLAQAATQESQDAEWQRYLKEAHQELVQTLTQPLDAAAALKVDKGQVEKRLGELIRQGQRLARALHAWPAICTAAAQLR